jgi:hypothetical protein
MESSWFIESTHHRVASLSANVDPRAASPLPRVSWRQPR